MLGLTNASQRVAALVAFAVLWSVSATVAVAQVPTQIPFQGRLLDALGAPVNDSVDLDFELFDAIANGTSLWSESHLGVIVVDGIYSVDLGSQTPLTQGVLSGGSAFLEITVGGETLVPRQQLLSVPYALVAEEAVGIGGVPAVVFQEVWSSFSFDGNPPANTHPDEGVADTDGDGVPNFLDADNDNDGIDDGVELLAGTSINVISPRIDSVSPNSISSFAATTLLVTGEHLSTLTSVGFAGESPTPTNLSDTSFSIDILAETLSSAEPVTLSVANGEAGRSSPVAIQAVAPTITSLDPPFAQIGQTTIVTINGTGFYPGTTVEFGTQSLVPTAITETSITVTLVPEPLGTVTVEVVHPNTLSASVNYPIGPVGPKVVFLSDTQTNGNLGGVAGANAICEADAVAASLPGTFVAWVSESVAGGTSSPAATFRLDAGPYLTPLGGTIANDWTGLTDGTLDLPINVTASGATGVTSFVWTGTNADGTANSGPSDTCAEWTSAAATGSGGSASQLSTAWTENLITSAHCAALYRIYCFEQ